MEINTIDCNTKRITDVFSYTDFKQSDTIIISSGTGTGKTYCFSSYVKKYIQKNPEKKIISIFGKRNLGMQQKKYLENEELEIQYYTDNDFYNNSDGNILVCINSLYKHKNAIMKNIENYVLFIDEVSIFTTEITHNDTLVELKGIYVLLRKLIRECHKLYVCQNEINISAMELIKPRLEMSNKNIYINNVYKNNKNKKAIKCENLNILIEKMQEDISNNKYFLFCSDSKKDVDTIFTLLTKGKENASNYIKFTSSSKDKFSSDFDFKHKYVFYSPTIGAGVDVSLADSQNHYLYIHGNSVDSQVIYQMSMRTRNLKELIYCCNPKIKTKAPKYSSLEDCRSKLISDVRINDKSLLSMCYNIDMDDEMVFTPNSFFEIFARNEYVTELYFADLVVKFEEMLILNGFTVGKNNSLAKKYDWEIENVIDLNTEIEYNDFIQKCQDGNLDENLQKACDILRVHDFEDKIKYQDILRDKYKLQGHLNLCRFFSDKDFLQGKIEEITKKIYDVKLIQNVYNQILHLKYFMEKYKIDIFDLNKNSSENIKIAQKDLSIMHTVFRFSSKIATRYELIKFVVSRLNTMCNCKVITAKKTKVEKKSKNGKDTKQRVYYINDDELNYHFDLLLRRNNFRSIEEKIVEYLGIEILDEDLYDTSIFDTDFAQMA